MSDDPLDELADQANRSRKDTEPTADTDDETSLEDEIADAFAAMDSGNATEHLTTRDRKLSALFAGLDNAGQLAALAEQAAGPIEYDANPETQADAIRVLLRYAINDLDDSLFEAGKDGLETYRREKAEREAEQASENPF